MSVDNTRADFLVQYKTISNKLKKRFLRKPNVAEASEQFSLLTKELQRQECPHYAAFCCLAVARCERTLGNGVGETRALLQSGRLFLEAEHQNQRLLCPSFGEHLVGALSCYSAAFKALTDQKQTSLAAALCLELGEELRGAPGSHALPCFQTAAQLQAQCIVDYLSALDKVASCKLDSGDFDGALSVLTEMFVVAQEKVSSQNGRPLGILSSYLMDTEITRLLLLLLLEPPFQKLRHEDSQTLQKYSLDSAEPEPIDIYQNEDLFLLLQSLVMACQTKEQDILKQLQKELWPLLSAQQNMILQQTLSRLSESTV